MKQIVFDVILQIPDIDKKDYFTMSKPILIIMTF